MSLVELAEPSHQIKSKRKQPYVGTSRIYIQTGAWTAAWHSYPPGRLGYLSRVSQERLWACLLVQHRIKDHIGGLSCKELLIAKSFVLCVPGVPGSQLYNIFRVEIVED